MPFIAKEYGYTTDLQAPVSVFLWWLVTYSSFGIRFGNFYFSAIWLAGTVNAAILNYGEPLWLAPLFLFLWYQVLRYRHWLAYDREFIPIPPLRKRYGKRPVWTSALAGRQTDSMDHTYSIILFAGATLGMFLYGLLTLPN